MLILLVCSLMDGIITLYMLRDYPADIRCFSLDKLSRYADVASGSLLQIELQLAGRGLCLLRVSALVYRNFLVCF